MSQHRCLLTRSQSCPRPVHVHVVASQKASSSLFQQLVASNKRQRSASRFRAAIRPSWPTLSSFSARAPRELSAQLVPGRPIACRTGIGTCTDTCACVAMGPAPGAMQWGAILPPPIRGAKLPLGSTRWLRARLAHHQQLVVPVRAQAPASGLAGSGSGGSGGSVGNPSAGSGNTATSAQQGQPSPGLMAGGQQGSRTAVSARIEALKSTEASVGAPHILGPPGSLSPAFKSRPSHTGPRAVVRGVEF